MNPDILSLIVGIALGSIPCVFYFKVKIRSETFRIQAEQQGEMTTLRERLLAREDSLSAAKSELQSEIDTTNNLRSQNTELHKELAQLKERLSSEEERAASLAEVGNRFSEAFKALSLDALKSNNQSFLELANTTLEKFQESARGDLEKRGTAINELVKPINESLTKVDGKLEELERLRQSSQAVLAEQMKVLSQTNLSLKEQTENLVQALRKPHVRGRWGEVQLKRVVELANMLPYCDFVEQESVTTDNGKLRPDMIIKLPGSRNIIVDSKVPLEAFLNAIEAKEESHRETLFKDHARQIRQQILSLASKSYWQQFDKTPEFVILFLPGETFFSSGLEHDPNLLEFAAERNIILATPISLIALLRAVAYGWREQEFSKNTEVVAKIGRELYERIVILVEHLGNIKKGLDRTVDAYNETVASVERRVLVSVRKFRDLGVATADPIPDLPEIDNTTKITHLPND